jgi:hypothetical protein
MVEIYDPEIDALVRHGLLDRDESDVAGVTVCD